MLLVAIVTGAKADVDLSQGASYDFTTITASAFANVGNNYWKADGDTPTYYGNGSGFKPTSASAFMLNATEEIAGFEGLQITTGSSSGRVRIYVNGNGLYFNSDAAILTFPGLKKDQVITIGYANASSDEAQFTVTNATAVQNTSTHVETLTVQANGAVTLTYNSKKFYIKTIEISSSGPSISASNVNISKEATNEGEIAFTVNNSVEGGVVTAAEKEEADWLTLGDVDNTNGKVPFTAEANTATSSRSAVVKLTYTYDTNKTATKEVTITQAPDVDGTAIVRATITSATSATVTGSIGGTSEVKLKLDTEQYKFAGKGNYVGITLADGYFQEGDVINIHTTTAAQQGTIMIYDSKEGTNIYQETGAMGVLGDNKFVLNSTVGGKSTIYVCRTETNNWNGFVDFIEVTRPNATISLNASGFATYSSAYDFEYAGADAYGMELTANSLQGTKVTTGKIKAGEGILFKGEAGAKVSIIETTGAADLENNSLKGTTDADNEIISSSYNYKYALSGDTFKKLTGPLVANKAFFGTDEELSNSLDLVFDGATAINNVNANDNANSAAPVKVIKNGQLYIGNYNVAGQQVK